MYCLPSVPPHPAAMQLPGSWKAETAAAIGQQAVPAQLLPPLNPAPGRAGSAWSAISHQPQEDSTVGRVAALCPVAQLGASLFSPLVPRTFLLNVFPQSSIHMDIMLSPHHQRTL